MMDFPHAPLRLVAKKKQLEDAHYGGGSYPHGRKRRTVFKFAVTDGDNVWTSTLFCFPACNGAG